LQIGFDQTSGSLTFYLHNTTTTAVDNISLIGAVNDAAGQVISAATASFFAPGGAQPPTSWSVPASGIVPVVLKLDNLPIADGLKSTIVAESVGSAETLGTVEIVRRPKVIVLTPGQITPNTSAAASIALSTTTQNPHVQLTLDNVGAVDVNNLTLEAGPLTRKDGAGQQGSVTIGSDNQPPQPLKLAARALTTVQLNGTLPEATAYSGWLGLHYGYGDGSDPQVDVYGLDWTRTAPGNTFAIDDIKPVAADGWFALSIVNIEVN
jgi:hypothetical protein